jgi:thiamine-monophosphate kinase
VRYADVPKDESFKNISDENLERRCVLSGGEDYELLFTVPRERREQARALPDVSLIGEIVRGRDLKVIDAAGKPIAHAGGFDHFA